MESYKFTIICKNIIIDYYKKMNIELNIKDIYTVWECKTLQNNKALLSTNITDGKYFECTYNGDKKELYFDAYIKEKNEVISYDNFNKEMGGN